MEANYIILSGDGFFGDDDFVDVGLKFWFVNFGLFYDISKRFFVQVQYDVIDLDLIDDSFNKVRLGLGFRF